MEVPQPNFNRCWIIVKTWHFANEVSHYTSGVWLIRVLLGYISPIQVRNAEQGSAVDRLMIFGSCIIMAWVWVKSDALLRAEIDVTTDTIYFIVHVHHWLIIWLPVFISVWRNKTQSIKHSSVIFNGGRFRDLAFILTQKIYQQTNSLWHPLQWLNMP